MPNGYVAISEMEPAPQKPRTQQKSLAPGADSQAVIDWINAQQARMATALTEFQAGRLGADQMRAMQSQYGAVMQKVLDGDTAGAQQMISASAAPAGAGTVQASVPGGVPVPKPGMPAATGGDAMQAGDVQALVPGAAPGQKPAAPVPKPGMSTAAAAPAQQFPDGRDRALTSAEQSGIDALKARQAARNAAAAGKTPKASIYDSRGNFNFPRPATAPAPAPAADTKPLTKPVAAETKPLTKPALQPAAQQKESAKFAQAIAGSDDVKGGPAARKAAADRAYMQARQATA